MTEFAASARRRAVSRLVLNLALLIGSLSFVFVPSLHAQFGRNKLQHQVFDFKIISTEHFDVYYYPEEQEAALDAARIAERSYSRLSRILAHEFDERKPIILYASHSQFQQTNALPGFISEGTGGVTEFAKRRVILPFTGSYAEFEHVLTHELVHAFQFDIIARGFTSQFSPYAFQIPLWFMEGMAEYLSIGKIDSHTHSWLRDAVLSGYIRTIPEMSVRDDYLSYRFGQSLWAFIGAKYGDETVGLLLQRTTRLGLDLAFQTTLGIPLEQLSSEWIESVRTTYLPEAAQYAELGEIANRITNHTFFAIDGEFASFLSPALSPDGSEVVYISDRGSKLYSFFDLWLASAEDGEVKARLIKTSRNPDFESLRFLNASASWSPDGQHITFVAKDGGRDALYVFDVHRRRVVRKIKIQLDGVQNPTFSPDGLRIAFTGLNGGLSDLYVIDVTGERFQQLTDDKYADLHPAWSPDGRYIAIATDRGEETDFDDLVYGNFRIALYRVGRGEIEIIPYQNEGKNINPAWSPDGKAIAFISDRTGISNVFAYDREEERLYQLTDLLSGVTGITALSPAISWAARSDRLAVAYFEGAGYNVYVIDDPRSLGWPVEGEPAPPPLIAASGNAGPARAGGRATALFQLGARGSHETIGANGTDGGNPHAGGGSNGSNGGRGLGEPDRNDSEAGGVRTQSFYRVKDGFRPSAEKPRQEEVEPAEITIADLLEDTRRGLPDTVDFQQRDYEVTLSPDVVGQPVIGGQVGGGFGAGAFGGGYILLSDMLGNHNALLSAQVAGSFNDAYILTQYAYLRERTNLAMSYRQFPIYRFGGTAVGSDNFSTFAEEQFVRDVYRTLSTEAHYPLNTFQRLEFSLSGVYLSRDSVIDRTTVTPTLTKTERVTRRVENLVFAGPSVALVWDNALYGYTGPIAGSRYRIEAGRFFGDVELNNVLVDFRNYMNIGGMWSFATRLSGLWKSGESEDEFRYYWGSPYFLRGYDGGSFSAAECIGSAIIVKTEAATACPVRDQLIGSSVFLVSNEFRFPIIALLDLGVVPLGLPPIDGAIFFDVGVAFNSIEQLVWSRPVGADPVIFRKPLASYGIGIRMNILFAILRLDYALPLDRPRHSGGVWSFSFGPSF